MKLKVDYSAEGVNTPCFENLNSEKNKIQENCNFSYSPKDFGLIYILFYSALGI